MILLINHFLHTKKDTEYLFDLKYTIKDSELQLTKFQG